MGISGGGEDLEDSVVDGEKGNVEGSSSKIVDDDLLLDTLLLVESVGDGGGGRLVDDSKNGESGDGSGVLGGLSLSVVEVCERGGREESQGGVVRSRERERGRTNRQGR